MKVVYKRADGRRKVGQTARMTEAKAKEMIAKNIVEEYTGEWPRKHKMKFQLKNLITWQ